MPRRRYAELILLLGALTAFGPLSIDMYLPALPTLENVFGADGGRVQWTLASFFSGFAIGQTIYGPIADRFGRKQPLYASLTLFVLASAGCALTKSIDALIGLRFLQAVGACAGGVISRAMVRDLFAPHETARVYSTLLMVFGVAPILAPLAGGQILIASGWRAIFWLLAFFGACCLIAVIFRLPETHVPTDRSSLRVGRVLSAYAHILSQRSFLGYAVTVGFAMAGMFAYITGSPFVFIELFQTPPERFGFIFGSNALGLIVASRVNVRLLKRFESRSIVKAALAFQAAAGLLLFVHGVTGAGGFWAIVGLIFACVASNGFVLPNCTALAMAGQGRSAGAASALLGTLQFGIAALIAAVVGAAENGTAAPMTGVMAFCGVAALTLNHFIASSSSSASSDPHST